MSTVYDIYKFIDSFAPFNSAMDFDNVGILIKCKDEVKRALISLDASDMAINKAKDISADLIITHHPVIFRPVKKLSCEDIPFKLISNGISVISAHTNLDMSSSGVNSALASSLKLKNIEPFEYYKDIPCALMGSLEEPLNSEDFAKFVKLRLKCGGIKYIKGKKIIEKVALCSGAGGDILFGAKDKRADAFVTGEVKHHEFLLAQSMGVTVVEAGHFETENIIIKPLKAKLSKHFSDVEFFDLAYKDGEIFYFK